MLAARVVAAGAGAALLAPSAMGASTISSTTAGDSITVPADFSDRVFASGGPLSSPDDITLLGGNVFVAYQNGVGSKGEPSPGGGKTARTSMPTDAPAMPAGNVPRSVMMCRFRDQGEAVGDEGFRVHPDALKSYDKVIQEQAEQIARIWPKLAAVPLSSDDFGKLPNAHNLYEAYHEHVEAEQHNFADLLEILRSTGDGLQNSATNYESQDHHIDASFGGGQ